MPQASSHAWSVVATRAVTAAFVVALLFTASAGFAAPAAVAQSSDQISATRRSQTYSESLMLKQDRLIEQLKRQRKITARSLRTAQKIAKRSRRGQVAAARTVRIRSRRLAKAEALYADATEAPRPNKWRAKMRGLRTGVRVSVKRRQVFGRKLRLATRNRKARFRRLAILKRQNRAAVARREAAERALSASIASMTRLAQRRAVGLSATRLGPNNSTFAWPAVGTITQPFGCTGLRSNSPRGSCPYFHRGIDLVAGYGSAVRSAAVGVVAYVGFNPLDQRGRAFMVVVAHPNGYITRYAHLIATRVVRAGQVVRKGQPIGKMGSSGFSTGTHVHMEILQGSTPLNPLAFLPDGVVTIRGTDSKPGKSKAAKRKAAKSRATKRKKATAARRAKSAKAARKSARAATADRDATAAKAASADESSLSCPLPAEPPAELDATVLEARLPDFLTTGPEQRESDAEATCELDETADDAPGPALSPTATLVGGALGVPIPFRGTSAMPQ